MELGTPGEMRARLNALVLAGIKRATAGLLAEYAEEDEQLETVGERMALVDDDLQHVGTVVVTSVDVMAFGDVTWEFAQAEGEGHTSLEHWRAGHRRYWGAEGRDVTDATQLVCLRMELDRELV